DFRQVFGIDLGRKHALRLLDEPLPIHSTLVFPLFLPDPQRFSNFGRQEVTILKPACCRLSFNMEINPACFMVQLSPFQPSLLSWVQNPWFVRTHAESDQQSKKSENNP